MIKSGGKLVILVASEIVFLCLSKCDFGHKAFLALRLYVSPLLSNFGTQ